MPTRRGTELHWERRMALLDVRGLSVTLDAGARSVALVRDISLTIEPGETVCIVGESGSGKTVTALSITRLLEYTAPVSVSGEIWFDGREITAMDPESVADLRGDRIGMVFQECMEALNPTRRIGHQLAEVFSYHRQAAGRCLLRGSARDRAAELLRAVEIRDPIGCLSKYPHQLSGGMQQRVMIAMALMCEPALIIADEPTTALDVTVQADILRLLAKLRRDRGMACLLITHDLGIAAQVAEKIGVMYAGRLVEFGPADNILRHPMHPYTRGLLSCIPTADHRHTRDKLISIRGSVPHPSDDLPGCRFAPRCSQVTTICVERAPELKREPNGTCVACWNVDTTTAETTSPRIAVLTEASGGERDRAASPVIVRAENVSKQYAARARFGGTGKSRPGIAAVDGVDLEIRSGEFFGLVGETGSGKSTLGRLIANLEQPTSGAVEVGGVNTGNVRGSTRAKEFRRKVQVIFQNAHGSLDPRLTIGQSLAEPLIALGDLRRRERGEQIERLLSSVGLDPQVVAKRPGELSGGQVQRVAIARAIAVDPQLLIADEPTSALDVSVQAQVMNLLVALQSRLNLTYLFISHNLTLLLAVADRIGVMYLGALVEVAPAEILASRPAHPYSAALLLSNPDPQQAAEAPPRLSLAPPTALNTATDPFWDGFGCRFRSRCPSRQQRCDTEAPPLHNVSSGHSVACHFPLSASRLNAPRALFDVPQTAASSHDDRR